MLCIEVKRPNGKLTEDQKTFLSEMSELGAICLVARSLDDVVLLLAELAIPSAIEV